jgi:ribosomal protein L29
MQHLSDQCRQNREIGEMQGTEQAAKRIFELEEELFDLRSTLTSYQNR